MSTNQSLKETTHRNILVSALKVFSHKGYNDATIKEIHELAGCNALTVFRHFKDKESLFYSVVEAYKDIRADSLDVYILIDSTDPEPALRQLAEVYFKIIFIDNLDILRIFINECTAFPALRKDAWFISPVLMEDFMRRISAVGFAAEPRHAELFVGYVTRLCLEFNTHDRVWDYSEALLDTFNQKMGREVVLMADMMQKKRQLARKKA